MAQVGDFDADGRSDVLWRDSAAAATYVWLLNGATIAAQGTPNTTYDATWFVIRP